MNIFHEEMDCPEQETAETEVRKGAILSEYELCREKIGGFKSSGTFKCEIPQILQLQVCNKTANITQLQGSENQIHQNYESHLTETDI